MNLLPRFKVMGIEIITTNFQKGWTWECPTISNILELDKDSRRFLLPFRGCATNVCQWKKESVSQSKAPDRCQDLAGNGCWKTTKELLFHQQTCKGEKWAQGVRFDLLGKGQQNSPAYILTALPNRQLVQWGENTRGRQNVLRALGKYVFKRQKTTPF